MPCSVLLAIMRSSSFISLSSCSTFSISTSSISPPFCGYFVKPSK
nr:MAG TPA: hypothetical protein [Caudoviricetes sp.]